MIQERLKTSLSRQKSYADQRRRPLEFSVGDHVFLRVTPFTGVGRALKSKKLTSKFIGPYQILRKIGLVAYEIALPPPLANIHNIFHVSQLRKYVSDPSHILESDSIQVKENLSFEVKPIRILDSQVKQFRGRSIPMMKVLWISYLETPLGKLKKRYEHHTLISFLVSSFSRTKIFVVGNNVTALKKKKRTEPTPSTTVLSLNFLSQSSSILESDRTTL